MKPRWIVYSVIGFLVLITAFVLSASAVHAGPPAPIVFTLRQPDGTSFQARRWGDEWSNGVETLDGYSVLLDRTTGYWVYAVRGANGELVPSIGPSGSRVVKRDDSASLQRHSRPDPSRRAAPAGSRITSSPKAIGAQKLIVLLVSFSNQSAVGTNANHWSTKFFGASGSVKSYYEEVSYTNLQITPAGESHGTVNDGVVGWLTLSYAHPNTADSTGDANRQIVRDAILASDPYVNYASFDTNGDGYLSYNELHIAVVVAGYETSYAMFSCGNSIWAHRWSLDGSVSAPIVDGKRVASYAGGGGYIQMGEWHCDFFFDYPGHAATIGTMAHELGHDIGLPDLYDIDYSSAGVGMWSIMSTGAWNDTTGIYPGSTPAHPDAWSRSYEGWTTPIRISGLSPGRSIPQIETSGMVFQLLNNPNAVDWSFGSHSGSGEYFLVENRQRVGFDAGLPQCGLLIWHIDEGIRYDNYANANESHRLVDLEQADGFRDLNNPLDDNYGDTGDPYPGSTGNRTFNALSNPNSNLYSGLPSGAAVTQISDCGTTMTATLQGDIVAPVNSKIFLPLVARDLVGIASGWRTFVSTSFEGLFPGDWSLASSNTYAWGKRDCKPFSGLQSGWAVGGGVGGSGNVCGTNYPDDINVWMIYGPFSLADATAAEMRNKLWLNSNDNDQVCQLASIDGNLYYGNCSSGDSSGWADQVLDLATVPTLGNLLGQPNVWVALAFMSDSSVNKPEGAYVDDVLVRECPTGETCAPGTTPSRLSGRVIVKPAVKQVPKR